MLPERDSVFSCSCSGQSFFWHGVVCRHTELTAHGYSVASRVPFPLNKEQVHPAAVLCCLVTCQGAASPCNITSICTEPEWVKAQKPTLIREMERKNNLLVNREPKCKQLQCLCWFQGFLLCLEIDLWSFPLLGEVAYLFPEEMGFTFFMLSIFFWAVTSEMFVFCDWFRQRAERGGAVHQTASLQPLPTSLCRGWRRPLRMSNQPWLCLFLGT